MMFLTVDDLHQFAQFLTRAVFDAGLVVCVDDYFLIQVGGETCPPRVWELGPTDSLGGLQYRLADWVCAMRASGQHEVLSWVFEEGSLISVHQ